MLQGHWDSWVGRPRSSWSAERGWASVGAYIHDEVVCIPHATLFLFLFPLSVRWCAPHTLSHFYSFFPLWSARWHAPHMLSCLVHFPPPSNGYRWQGGMHPTCHPVWFTFPLLKSPAQMLIDDKATCIPHATSFFPLGLGRQHASHMLPHLVLFFPWAALLQQWQWWGGMNPTHHLVLLLSFINGGVHLAHRHIFIFFIYLHS